MYRQIMFYKEASNDVKKKSKERVIVKVWNEFKSEHKWGQINPSLRTLATNQTEIPYPKPLKHSNRNKNPMRVRRI